MLNKILYPTDFSDSARAALAYVKKLHEAGATQVVLLHVYDSRMIDLRWEIESEYTDKGMIGAKDAVVKRLLDASYKRLQELETELADTGFETELIVVEGIPYQEITKTAADKDVSLIIMGSHGEHGVVERIIGSTTERVLRETSVPILVVRPTNNEH
jgi:nucleotide-binding universal stress UspA family protein